MAPIPLSTSQDFKLEQVRQLMKALGNPQDNLRIIHIAGTSGKTSTAYYMAALLKAGGQKVGLTVSPHVDSVNERVQIDGRPLPEAEFCRELTTFLKVVQDTGLQPSYFVLLYAFAMWVFDRQEVNYAVVETGIGGLHDATNVTGRPDKVCIITDIGFDHTSILGKTLAEIATQKIGIVHERNNVFMYRQPGRVMQAIRKRTVKCQARIHLLDERAERRIWLKNLTDIAGYQQRNWLLAYGVYRYLEHRDGLKHLTYQVLQTTQTIRVPGRMDAVRLKGKTLVMDGAHNAQKMSACINSFQHMYPGVKPATLLSVKDDKDYEGLLHLLVPFSSRIIVTTFDTAQDSQVHSMNPEKLGRALREAGASDVKVIADQHEAFQTLLASPGSVYLITGSFYLLSQLRNDEGLV